MQCWKSAAVSHTTTTALLLNFQNYGEEPFDDFFRGDIYNVRVFIFVLTGQMPLSRQSASHLSESELHAMSFENPPLPLENVRYLHKHGVQQSYARFMKLSPLTAYTWPAIDSIDDQT